MDMESSDEESDEPLTPTGRVFLQPKINLVINCALIAEDPIRNLETFKAELESSVMLKHPRFCSLMVTDSDGQQHWKRTKVNVDRHLIIRHQPITSNNDLNISDEDILNDYLGELSYSSPLSTDKPLWEIHVLVAHKAAIFRVHHALGDGISLMSMLLSSCRRVEDPDQTPRIGGLGGRPSWMTRQGWSVRALVKVVLYTLIQFLEILLRVFWVKDEKTVLSGGDGVEFWPRKLVTARFSLDDMKVVKSAVDGSTINDVLFGIISSGLSRYLDIRSPKERAAPRDGLQITGAAMFNVRPESGLQDMSKLIWGNRFGMLVLPVYYQKPGKTHPLHYVKRAKAMIDKRKMSLMIPLWYLFGNLVITLFGPKLASEINYRVLSNTTFTITNIVGPQEKISLIGNPVKHIRGLTSSLPHALTLAMVSYAGEAELQISVAKDIISDPKVLAKCFEDALLEMKEAAAQATIIGS